MVSFLQAEELPTRAALTTSHAWTEIAPDAIDGWNDRLLSTHASLLQYPYWNEPYRHIHFSPRYLAWGANGRPEAYVCVLSVGPKPMKIGLILRGPISLSSNQIIPTAALADLRLWAARERFVLLRFTHDDHELLQRVASLGYGDRKDAFPFLRDAGATYYEMIVDQLPDDERMLTTFDREARRKIRRALEVGYEIIFSESPELLDRVWPVYLTCARRKHFQLNKPFQSYREMLDLAGRHHCGRVYCVQIDGKLVESGFVLRDRDTALCLLAALDPGQLEGRPSPSVLMHWRIMRDMYRLGATHYNLATAPGGVGQFKAQLNPRKKTFPPPVSLATNGFLYRLWSFGVLPLALWFMPILRKFTSRIRG